MNNTREQIQPVLEAVRNVLEATGNVRNLIFETLRMQRADQPEWFGPLAANLPNLDPPNNSHDFVLGRAYVNLCIVKSILKYQSADYTSALAEWVKAEETNTFVGSIGGPFGLLGYRYAALLAYLANDTPLWERYRGLVVDATRDLEEGIASLKQFRDELEEDLVLESPQLYDPFSIRDSHLKPPKSLAVAPERLAKPQHYLGSQLIRRTGIKIWSTDPVASEPTDPIERVRLFGVAGGFGSTQMIPKVRFGDPLSVNVRISWSTDSLLKPEADLECLPIQRCSPWSLLGLIHQPNEPIHLIDLRNTLPNTLRFIDQICWHRFEGIDSSANAFTGRVFANDSIWNPTNTQLLHCLGNFSQHLQLRSNSFVSDEMLEYVAWAMKTSAWKHDVTLWRYLRRMDTHLKVLTGSGLVQALKFGLLDVDEPQTTSSLAQTRFGESQVTERQPFSVPPSGLVYPSQLFIQ